MCLNFKYLFQSSTWKFSTFDEEKFKIIAHLNTKLKCLRHQSNRQHEYQFQDLLLTVHEHLTPAEASFF